MHPLQALIMRAWHRAANTNGDVSHELSGCVCLYRFVLLYAYSFLLADRHYSEWKLSKQQRGCFWAHFIGKQFNWNVASDNIYTKHLSVELKWQLYRRKETKMLHWKKMLQLVISVQLIAISFISKHLLGALCDQFRTWLFNQFLTS